jgi:hypothetical protein
MKPENDILTPEGEPEHLHHDHGGEMPGHEGHGH